MDGLENTGGGNKIFVNTYKGKFAVKTTDDDPEGTKRLNKLNATVYERYYNTLTGYLIGIEKYVPDMEKLIKKGITVPIDPSWNITLLTEKGTELMLNVPYSGRITMGIFGRFPNVDCGKQIRLRIFYFEDEDKSAIVIQQKNAEGKWENLPKYWTKEDPKHLPPMVQTVVNGKEMWDATAQMRYIERYLTERFGPELDKHAPMIIESFGGKVGEEQQSEESKMPDRELYEDDLPDQSDVVITGTPPQSGDGLTEEDDDLPF